MLLSLALEVVALVVHGIVEIEDDPLPPVRIPLLHLVAHGEEESEKGDGVCVTPVY